MNHHKAKQSISGLLGFLLLGTLLSLTAQQPAPPPQPGQQPAPQPAPQGQTQPAQPAAPAAPPENPAETAAYRDFAAIALNDFQKIIQVGEAFLTSYPQSRYNQAVYARLAQAYWNTNQHDKMVAAGEKTLELNPDHVDVLAMLANGIPRRLSQDPTQNEQQLQKTERYATRAIQLLEQIQQPPDLTPEQFQQARDTKLAMAHSGLGLVYFHRQRFTEAIREFEKATQLIPDPDPTDYFLLGLSYANANRFHEAADAFQKCGQMQWPWQARCQAQMEEAKKRAANQLEPPKP
ncbi:MAG: tetratricopeptide repeat protein [Firmicutes bacterium]|nr:tetratricopeptide repeat protein [Bacillota bacterium]